MSAFRRVHSTGAQAIVSRWADGWHIHINFREVNRAMTLEEFLTRPRLKPGLQEMVISPRPQQSVPSQCWRPRTCQEHGL
jgi:hypothetical protein